MKKILLKAFMLLCLILWGGVSSAWATEPVYTLSFTKDTGASSYTASHNTTSSNVTWAVYGNQSVGDNLRVGGKNTTATDRTLTSASTISALNAVSKISITHSGVGNGKSSSITINSIKVEGCTANTFASSKSKTISSPSVSSAGTLDFVLDEGNWDAASYYRITVNYQITGTNNCYLTIDKVDFYDASGGSLSSAGLEFGTTNYVYNLKNGANGFVAPTLTNPNSLSVTYSSDNTSVASVNATTGAVTVNGVGTAVITASSAETSEYYAGKASYTLKVVNINGDGTKANPYTVEDVKIIGAINENAWIIGTICGTAAGKDNLNAVGNDGNTNIALGTAESFIPVELNKDLDCRTALNIKDNPDLKGCMVKVYGNITTYFTTTGVKTVTDWEILRATITLNSLCTDGDFVYGTYSNASAWVVPADLVVSEVCVVDGELAIYSYNEGDIVPANAGVMVAAEAGDDYTVNLTTATATASPSGGENSLVGTGDGVIASEMAQADTEFFRLTMHNGTQIGFYWGADDGAAFDLGANKAYLAVATNNLGLSGSARSGLWFGDNEEALEAVEMNAATTIYTLEGVKVNELQKGLNIVNGKKVMVK